MEVFVRLICSDPWRRSSSCAEHPLHYGVGIPVRKVPGVLRELTGASITQSALTQDALRRAKGEVGAECRKLREAVKEAPFVHTDDMGCKIAGKPAFLMGFDTDQATVYQIRPQHRNEEVREIILGDYAGVMITDRGRSYEADEFKRVDQQKRMSRVLRNIAEVLHSYSNLVIDAAIATLAAELRRQHKWKLPFSGRASHARRTTRQTGTLSSTCPTAMSTG